MTYKEAMSLIKDPYRLNQYDAATTGYEEAEVGDNTRGYRIYIMDNKGYRYSPAHPQQGRKDDRAEANVFYWHNKRVALAYMAYLADSAPQFTYGLFEVEAIKGDPHVFSPNYNEHSAHYGQVAQSLVQLGGAPIQILTPEMIKEARQNPDVELFSE